MVPESRFLYFAYGSNMLTARLRARCPSARPLAAAVVQDFSLSFCKRGHDGSGKATLAAVTYGEGAVHGVLFEIAEAERGRLDAAEGPGYERQAQPVMVRADGERVVRAHCYVARNEARDESLIPFDWYHALVLAGALEHRLPHAYVDGVRAVSAREDPRPDRGRRQTALSILRSAGFDWLLEPQRWPGPARSR